MSAVVEREFLLGIVAMRRSKRVLQDLPLVLERLAVVCGARFAYVELGAEHSARSAYFGIARGWPKTLVRVDRAVIRRAIDEGRSIEIQLAVADATGGRPAAAPRVFCAPMRTASRSGAVYVERAGGPLSFSYRQREYIELVAMELELVAEKIAPRTRAPSRSLQDRTRQFQHELVTEALRRSGGNVSAVSRELCVTRGFVYRLIRVAEGEDREEPPASRASEETG